MLHFLLHISFKKFEGENLSKFQLLNIQKKFKSVFFFQMVLFILVWLTFVSQTHLNNLFFLLLVRLCSITKYHRADGWTHRSIPCPVIC